MKKLLVLVALATSIFAQSYLEFIADDILIKNSKNAVATAERIVKDLKKRDLINARGTFKDLIRDWKKVEGLYVAGELNEDLLDIPRFIDMYHQGNEDITVQLERILQRNEDLKIALYKNSHKTINALEFLLFKSEKITPRELEASLIIATTITTYLEEILESYEESREQFVNESKVANSAVINSLIDSAYKLKEWRVGDYAGLSRKHKGDPDERRKEFFLSGHSKTAILAILDLHESVIGEGNNFSKLAIEAGAEKEVNIVRSAIKEARENINDDTKLFQSFTKLYNSYYLSLIVSLEITSKIVDADGD